MSFLFLNNTTSTSLHKNNLNNTVTEQNNRFLEIFSFLTIIYRHFP